MGVYSNIDIKGVNDILSHYELGRAVSYEPTAQGISNSNFKVVLDNGNEILLKISNDKTIPQLENEQRILKVLSKYGFEFSPRAFETITGKPIYHHNNFYGVVFPFIKGSAPVKVDLSIAAQIGETLGKLHSLEIHAEDLDSIRPHELVGFGGTHIYDYTLAKDAASDYVQAFNKVFKDKLQNIPYDIFPAGIIHGDMYFDNSLFENGQLQTFIDFEQAGRGRFILDIGIAISGSCLNQEKTNIDNKLKEAFLLGYEKTRSLKAIEKEYMDQAILVGFFSIGLWRIRRFYDGNLDESKRYNYRDLINLAIAYEQTLSKERAL